MPRVNTPALPNDPRWPRAGGWPAADPEAGAGGRATQDLTLIGVPTWRTSLSATGAGGTPVAIREALRRYGTWVTADSAAATHGRDVGDLRIADAGDVDEPDGPEGEERAIAAVAACVEHSRFVVVLGGDNAATVPAALGAWGERITTAGLITLDAHHDLRDGVSNGSPVRRLIEAGLNGQRVVQVGIADFANSRDYAARAADYGIIVVHRDALHRRPMDDVMVEAIEIAGSAGGPVHLDVDVDVCDRSVAPGCPASAPGGISAHELRRAVRVCVASSLLTSMDLTEVDATADAVDGRTVRLAALCVLEAAAGLAGRTTA